ncbi:S41 family peptidase [Cohnella luojiensis]|uniref:S41 family peptidase n=1 Tax=Cohnella luojiensis TaxID=652876 RepID=A0A4Y8M599_9BACL|nr:S41 family peptidase [Cohnella luojiensis]TFE30099.1 S41 family peptidase [Cohnella luojiensis]
MNASMWRKLRITISFVLALALFGATAPAALGASAEQIEEVRDLLEQYHLSKPDDEDLDETEIDAMVESLEDPYTQYFDDEQWDSFNSVLEQTFVGIGIVLVEDNGTVFVEDVIPGSPAESAGVEPGDALVGANGKTLKGKTSAEVQSELRGAENSIVALSVSRNGKALKFKITRKSVQIPVVTTRLLEKGVGYLSLSGFTSNAGSEVKNQLEKLEQNGLTSLVFDLRNNGGGYVNAAQEIAGLFVEKGVLAHMRDREGVDHPLDITGSVKPYSVIILVNENSASASELLSGALQDYGVAKLVGKKTYGKGVVQSLIPVKSGGVLKVTVQEYYTPNGRKVDQVGLKPDLVVNGAAEQLIGAFRLAGGQKVTLTSGKGVITLNGVRMSQPGAAWKEKTVWYVNLKLATAMLGGRLTYEAKSHTLNLTVNDQIRTIKTNDSHIRIKNGHSHIDVRLLKKWFPGLSYSAAGETLKMITN